MDDRFLHGMRRDPDPEFARGLQERLHRQGPAFAPVPAWRPAQLVASLAGGLAVALVVLSFTVPAVRASAQAFLDLFRVRNFAAVSVDPAHMEQMKEKLQARGLTPDAIVGGPVETLEQPAAPRVVASADEAAAVAGFDVRVPRTLPPGYAADTISVAGQGALRFTVQTAKLEQALAALDLRDLEVPQGLDGQFVTVRTSPAVCQRFTREKRRVDFVQARSPEVSLPAGLDLARLGEIALRVAGLDAGEAHRFAQAIDWHSTLVVPVPLNASSFSEVSVHGQPGLLVRFTGKEGTDPHGHRRGGSLLLWSEDGMVYALSGALEDFRLVEMAESNR